MEERINWRLAATNLIADLCGLAVFVAIMVPTVWVGHAMGPPFVSFLHWLAASLH